MPDIDGEEMSRQNKLATMQTADRKKGGCVICYWGRAYLFALQVRIHYSLCSRVKNTFCNANTNCTTRAIEKSDVLCTFIFDYLK